MSRVHQIHTADLTQNDRAEIRRLLDTAFSGGFSDEDWEHTLGGLHFLVYDEDELVGHNAVVQRRLVHRGLSIRTGYVEGLAVRRNYHRRGHGSALMTAAERIIRRAYDLGALSDGTNIEGYYRQRGWLPWRGPTWAVTEDGLHRTADDDDSVLVFQTPTSPKLDLDEAIACDPRPGDVW